MTIEAWLGNSFWHMLHNFWWLWTLFGLGGAELFIKASCSSVCSVCIWRTHSCGVEYMLPHRSHFNGGKSLLSSFTSSWKRVFPFQGVSVAYIVVARADKNMLSSAYLPSLSPILGHVSVREFYMPHPIRRPVERLTAHVAGQWCILFFLHVCVLIRTVYDFLREEQRTRYRSLNLH